MYMATVNSSQSGKVWFITGASSGFGLLLTKYLLSLGAQVVATARKTDALVALNEVYGANLEIVSVDVTSRTQVDNAVKDALARFDHIDVLVNNAGYGVTGALEELTRDEIDPMFETNVFGLISVTQAVLPHMRARRSGHIVNLSSIGGLIGLPGWSMYNATKFAVEGISEALAAEVEPLGIKVTIIEPGPFRTEFLGASGKKSKETIADYQQTAGKTREYMDANNGKQAGDPQKAVEAIVAAVEAPKPPRHLLLGRLAYDRFRAKLDSFQAEIDAWKDTTLGADFEGEPAATPYK